MTALTARVRGDPQQKCARARAPNMHKTNVTALRAVPHQRDVYKAQKKKLMPCNGVILARYWQDILHGE